jgi:hypothetical protein
MAEKSEVLGRFYPPSPTSMEICLYENSEPITPQGDF